MRLLRILLFPFIPVYYFISWFRNLLFDAGILESRVYTFPVICVGNLSTGGTGKTPMVEYLVQLLKDRKRVAVLSRGYKRKTKGFLIASPDISSPKEIGDEPFQILRKFPDIRVAVDSNRRRGIEHLIQMEEPPEVIILDDAFQHRKVRAGLNILLTSYSKPYTEDILLPTGDLREPRSGRKRAQITVLTKCPTNISKDEKSNWISQLKFNKQHQVFFSSIAYDLTLVSANDQMSIEELKDKNITLVTGIANPKPLADFLTSKEINFEHSEFPDHHEFSSSEIDKLNKKEFILTTEKDFVRLEGKIKTELFYIPIKTELLRSEEFDELVLRFCVS